MTHNTEAERAEFERTVADGMYGGLIGLISDHWDSVKGEYKLFQHQVAWIAWQAARRAPSAPVPQGWKLVPVVATFEMLDAMHGVCSESGKPMQSKIDAADHKYASMLYAAPQPPEAAPVELPEPSGVVVTTIGNYASVNAAPFVRKGDKFYTEQQVRDLLANHGIKVNQ